MMLAMIRRNLVVGACLVLAVSVLAPQAVWSKNQTISGAKPAAPQPAADKLESGLAVMYFFNMFKKVDEIGKLGKGSPGKPIALLNHQTSDGNVLTSDRPTGV